MCIQGHSQQSEKVTHGIGEKRFANHISDKGLIPRIYKEFLQLKKKKKTTATQLKMAKGLE